MLFYSLSEVLNILDFFTELVVSNASNCTIVCDRTCCLNNNFNFNVSSQTIFWKLFLATIKCAYLKFKSLPMNLTEGIISQKDPLATQGSHSAGNDNHILASSHFKLLTTVVRQA